MSRTPADPSAEVVPARPVEPTGNYAVMSLVTGLVFLYLSWPTVTWCFTDFRNPYGYVWPDMRPMEYSELPAGTMWRDVGTLGSGLLLMAEAVLYGLAGVGPNLRRPALLGTAVAAGIGIAVNAVAAGMQIKAGFTAPLYAIIGVVVFVLSTTTALRLIRAR